ncbi:hypothetical protein [Ornithinibacillus californiensis]|uniref:hypothetical protein n=1 Tax=Ornithinibacillus californiensis TaxID=161536 RepID=UPI00064D9EA8|nr:hypothetical protein [Ornithinibacillus californiensis]
MEDILVYGGPIVYILLAGLFQFFISKSAWNPSRKTLFSIGLFMTMIVVHVIILIFLIYTPVMEGEGSAAVGYLFAFGIMWVGGLSFYAGLTQGITAIIVWAVKKIRQKS